MKKITKTNKLTKSFKQFLDELMDKKSNEKYASFYELKKMADFENNNIVAGDLILWIEPVFTGSYRNAKFSHYEYKYGEIIKDSYGKEKAQHSFMIKIEAGETVRKLGRTLFKECLIILNRKENFEEAQNEKNYRGQEAKFNALEMWLKNNNETHPNFYNKLERFEKMGGKI